MKLLTALLLLLLASAAQAADVGRWDRFEVTVNNTRSYENPYNDVTLGVTYTAPDGERIDFWGFYERSWSGGRPRA